MKAKRREKLYLVRFYGNPNVYLYRLSKEPARPKRGDDPWCQGPLSREDYIIRLCIGQMKKCAGVSLRHGEVREIKSIKFTFAK